MEKMKASISILGTLSCIYWGISLGCSFIGLGDWGADSKEQFETAQTLSKWCQKNCCRFIVTTGDNFYPSGISSPRDPRLETTWRKIYDRHSIKNLTWLVSLGNHDYGYPGGEKHQVEFGKLEPRWYMPNLWYSVPVNVGNTSVLISVIDTQAIIKHMDNYSKQLEWLDFNLGQSKQRWKIVVGHHPPYTIGKHHPGNRAIRESVVPILEKHKVDIFLLGHDHNLQHIRRNSTNKSGENMDYVISGAGGKTLYERSSRGEREIRKMGYSSLYFAKINGFVFLNFTKNMLLVKYVSTKSVSAVYQFSREKV